jgi:signal transduction histidine kinase
LVQAASELLQHRSFSELAVALRECIPGILVAWVEQVRREVPSARDLSDEQIRDHLPQILPAMADALESGRPDGAHALAEQSPAQGLTRFDQRYDVPELMTEDRLLRRLIIEQVQGALRRRMTLEEQIAVDMAVDMMLQQSVVAFVNRQKAQLRSAAEAELKYLSFLSHDLNNNLSGVTLNLQVLRQRLEGLPQFGDDVDTLDAAQQSILETIGGMGRLLQSERLRKSGAEPERRPVDLRQVASHVARQAAPKGAAKAVGVAVEVPPDCVASTDPELVGIVLQNLVGNAVKYSSKGTVRVGAECAGDWCVLFVSDEGPGIPAEQLERIFDAFERGDAHGQSGVGLGLAIASQASKLLGAELTVESNVGVGSTFRIALPAGSRGG